MRALNFKHLRYFWMVAKAGSIKRASEHLHLTPHSVSGQLAQFQEALGVELFRRSGRKLVLTDAGRTLLGYADGIFALGDEALDMLRRPAGHKVLRLSIGVADSVPKSVASRLLTPALHLDEPLHLICREGRLSALLPELSVHRLDALIADRPMPPDVAVRGYSHFLGESRLAVFGAPALLDRIGTDFPANLDGAPFLMPGEEVAFRAGLVQWLAANRLSPRVVAEFDDLALLKAFGQAGEGLFVAPGALSDFVCAQYGVRCLGEIADVSEQVYLITTARRITHPGMVAISRLAREELFRPPTEPARQSRAR